MTKNTDSFSDFLEKVRPAYLPKLAPWQREVLDALVKCKGKLDFTRRPRRYVASIDPGVPGSDRSATCVERHAGLKPTYIFYDEFAYWPSPETDEEKKKKLTIL